MVFNLPILGGGYFTYCPDEGLPYTIDIERAKLEADAYYARKGKGYENDINVTGAVHSTVV